MKLRPLIIALVVAVLGVVLQLQYMKQFEQESSGGTKIELLVAARPIQRGKPITAGMLGVRAVPQAYVDDRAIRAADRDKVLNLRAAAKVPVLQTLAWTDVIATTDDERDLSSLVQPGNRALPLRIESSDAMQLISPGDFVDIVTVDRSGSRSTVLLQRVLVLAAGLETTPERTKNKGRRYTSRLLTVSVNLQEAQMLTLAQSIGKLNMIVRNVDDPHVVDDVPDVDRAQLFELAARRRTTTVKAAPQRPVRLKPGARR